MHALGNSLLGYMPNRKVHVHDKSLYRSTRMLLSSPSVRASKEKQSMCLSAKSLVYSEVRCGPALKTSKLLYVK